MTEVASPPSAPGAATPAGPAGPPAWHRPATLGGVALAGTALLAAWDPSAHHVPLCPLKFVTGLDCPFCGCLRAVHSLTRLDVRAAADHNLLFTAAVPFLVVGWVLWLRRSLAGDPDPRAFPLPRWANVAVAALVVVFAVVRNLPALHWLAST